MASCPHFADRSRPASDRPRLAKIISRGLEGADDGELFLEYRQAEMLVFDNGRLKQATYDTSQGFGLRAVKDDAVGYAHASDVSEAAIARAADAVRAVKGGYSGRYAGPPARTNVKLYGEESPLGSPAFEAKARLLEAIDAYARARDPRVRQVSVSLGATWQMAEIVRANGETYRDMRPLVRVNVSVVVGDGDRQETGSAGYGGREGYERFIVTETWQNAVDGAVRQALTNLEAVPAPAGEMDVVLGPGWPGVMLHEAVGHGLEGDFNRKKTSAFAGLMGQRVAAKGITVVDDGTIALRAAHSRSTTKARRTSRTVLIDDGILVGYMQDRQNARLMGMNPTGNGRRESFAHVPMPRIDQHLHARRNAPSRGDHGVGEEGHLRGEFGGGQVDITSGKYVFRMHRGLSHRKRQRGAPTRAPCSSATDRPTSTASPWSATTWRSMTAIGTCGKNARACRSASASRRCVSTEITVGGTG